MPDPGSMMALLNGLKVATEIAKNLRELDASLEKAQAKSELAELINALADARISASDMKLDLDEKDRRIRELESALKVAGSVVRRGEAYFTEAGEGRSADGPFCSRCYDVDRRLVHLNRHPVHGSQKMCPECKASCRV